MNCILRASDRFPPPRFIPVLLFALAVPILIYPYSSAQEISMPAPQAEESIVLRQGYVFGPVGRYGRSPIHSDPVEYALVKGTFDPPREGAEGDWTWVAADEEGWFEQDALAGGYLFIGMNADSEKVMILEAAGHSFAYLNGIPRGGDVYSYGWLRQPVLLQRGENHLLFRAARGRVRARLSAPRSPAALLAEDATLPDLLLGEEEPLLGAVRITNSTEKTLEGLRLLCRLEGSSIESEVRSIAPLMTRKVSFLIKPPRGLREGPHKIELVLRASGGGSELDRLQLELTARPSSDPHRTTFLSGIDGSVQYYAVRPGAIEGGQAPALFLSLHGASVEAEGQARCYEPKSWGHVAAPTNRRPYGFDWEDWGRLDALEVLDLAAKRFGADPSRIYLTGHSMGGHGTWHLGATYPDRFAAIAPSAGWVSFWSYAGKRSEDESSALVELVERASRPSDTLGLKRNHLHHGVYVLHGSADDNVPVDQARTMREQLAGYHADFAYFEKPGAGHWWGNACCDWPPLFDFLRNHVAPSLQETQEVEFVTAHPGISSQCRWVILEAQEKPFLMSSIRVALDRARRTFTGATENAARLCFLLGHLDPGPEIAVALDGLEPIAIEVRDDQDRVWMEKRNGVWTAAEAPDPGLKGPRRCGPFKEAFRNNMLFCYATGGTPEERSWAFEKARFDAETFAYRGNGSIDLVADYAFDPALEPDRNVILYGNRDTHAAWDALLKTSPVQVRRGEVRIGEREIEGADLGCCFVRPRPGSDRASLGVVSGTGIEGMRSANANLYFISGAGFPDLLVFGSDMLSGLWEGVRAAGYFGIDWSVEGGEFAFSE